MGTVDQQEFERHIGAIAAAPIQTGIKDEATAALAVFGFKRWLYASDNPYGTLGFPATLGEGFGKWLLTYMIKNYQRVDPIVAHCRASAKPLLWDPTVGWDTASDEVQAFMRDVAAHGFGSGVAIPLHVPDGPQGVLSVTSAAPLSETRPHFEEKLPRLVQIGQTTHGAMINMLKESSRLQHKACLYQQKD